MNGAMRAFAGLAATVALTAQSPAPASSADPFALDTFHYGETAAALVAVRGEPVLRRPLPGVESQTAFQYLYIAGDGATLVLAFVDRGNVVALHVRPGSWSHETPAHAPAALGVPVGADAAALETLATKYHAEQQTSGDAVVTRFIGERGLRYSYTVVSGKVHDVYVGLVPEDIARLSTSDEPALHGGTSPSDAIVYLAPNEDVGVRSEYAYLGMHECGSGGSWKTKTQALVRSGGRSYDQLDVQCSAGGAERAFFFDITAFFGKL